MKFNKIILFLLAILCCSPLFAKTITLYDQPKTDGKVIGTIDSGAGLILIYSPKDNTAWVKVGDPRNGNVGWVQSKDIGTGSNFSFQVITKDNGPESYQVIQVGMPKLSQEQTEKMMKDFQARQALYQQQMQKWLQNFQKDMNQMFQDNFPMMMPAAPLPPSATTPAAPTTVPATTNLPVANQPVTPAKKSQ